MHRKIFYLPKSNTFLVGENYAIYHPFKCLNGKWKISQGVGSFIEKSRTAMEYVPDLLLESQSDYLLKSFVEKFINRLNHSEYSNLILIVPNGEFGDSFFLTIADVVDSHTEESCTLHFVSEPPPRSKYTINLSLPFPVDDLVTTGFEF